MKKVHITDPKGTDLTLELSEAHMDWQRKDRRWHGKLICDARARARICRCRTDRTS